MFGSPSNGATAYAKVGLETGVTSASPNKLIVMLYEGALIAIAAAMQHMKAGEIAAKGQAISKAISIIDSGLRASLNKEAGGDVSRNLDALYEYMSTRLLLANANNQLEYLEEVQRLLRDLKGAWETIGASEGQVESAGKAGSPAASQQLPQPPVYDALKPGAPRLMKA